MLDGPESLTELVARVEQRQRPRMAWRDRLLVLLLLLAFAAALLLSLRYAPPRCEDELDRHGQPVPCSAYGVVSR